MVTYMITTDDGLVKDKIKTLEAARKMAAKISKTDGTAYIDESWDSTMTSIMFVNGVEIKL